MKTRPFGAHNHPVSEIGFGAWAIGGDWGDVSEADAKKTLHASLDAGCSFIDTADVYGDGRSERIVADVLKERGGDRPFVATKAGRRLSPHVAEGYNAKNLSEFVERSRRNLEMDCLDLVQLHCPPTETYYQPATFDAMESLREAGKINAYGVSVEKVEEALKAIEYPGVQSVQIIYNIFRQRPADLLFQEAKKRNISIIVRVPLASGVLTGKMTKASTFAQDDHRSYNRNGEAFDRGETFAGVPFDLALDVVEEIRELVPDNATMAQYALRWILMEDAVSVVIPGAKSEAQAQANAEASALPALSESEMTKLRKLYKDRLAPHVHHYW